MSRSPEAGQSKSNCLGVNPVAKKAMQTLLFDDIDTTTQGFFQIGDKATREKWGCLRTSFDQKIQITVGTRVASGEGTKHLYVCDTMTPGDCEDAIAVERM